MYRQIRTLKRRMRLVFPKKFIGSVSNICSNVANFPAKKLRKIRCSKYACAVFFFLIFDVAISIKVYLHLCRLFFYDVIKSIKQRKFTLFLSSLFHSLNSLKYKVFILQFFNQLIKILLNDHKCVKLNFFVYILSFLAGKFG